MFILSLLGLKLRRKVLIGFLMVFSTILWSCGQKTEEDKNDETIDVTYNEDLTTFLNNRADSILCGMTLEQRVGQCFMPAMMTSDDAYTLKKLRSYISDLHVGGILLLKGDLKSAAVLADEGNSAEIPLFISIDAEWGLGMRLMDAPSFPRNGRIGDNVDESLLFEYGREVARECKRVGVNMVLGPVIDVVENPSGVIGNRSFGGDPVRVADLGIAYAKGLEGGGIISVAKHFPGHGALTADSHYSLPVDMRNIAVIDSIDLYPFRKFIDSDLTGIMVGHLSIPAIDPEGRPGAVSSKMINGLLRETLGFEGLVLTDALNMAGASGYSAADALTAGADIIVAPSDTDSEIRKIINLVEKGEIPVELIDERCHRILFYKELANLRREGKIRLDGLREEVGMGADSINSLLSGKNKFEKD